MLWNPNSVNITINEESSQHVHAEVQVLQTNQRLNLTCVYAHNYYISGRALWSNLEEIESRTQLPSILVGDFNVVKSSHERCGSQNYNPIDMTDLNDCISNCSLTDIQSIGHSWTWNNRSKGEPKEQAKLDRAMVNDLWLQEHPNPMQISPPGIFDHCPITIALNPRTPQGPKPLKFFNMWLEDASLYPIVERAWATEIIGNPMYQFTQKLNIVKNHIRAWNENVFGRIDVKTPLVRKELSDFQVMLHSDLTNAELAEREGVLSQKLPNLAAMEESFY
ncbi:uncharacterized protein LOC143878786 [Tasmannia lanceolata]|uniref:uncharacterized protein LOC143878786 n=1 Tax=Tasmannia lanceolata TaxID=3420 RepID=UPI004063C0B2